MKSVFDGYTPVTELMGETYFAGANTGLGFRSAYGEDAGEDELLRLYIIKGSSGSGKSTLMKKIARHMVNAGHELVYYLCGSDPTSLDSIVIDGKVAILDGTPPHVVEMKYPHVKSEIIDLSKFLNDDRLYTRRDEVVFHTIKKNNAYSLAYRYLAAAQQVEDGIMADAAELFDRDKARRFVTRFVDKLRIKNRKERGVAKHKYTYAISMRGLYRIENSLGGFDVYEVVDSMRCAPILMEILAFELINKGADITLCHTPISNHIGEIVVPSHHVRIVTSKAENKIGRINTARFIKGEVAYPLHGEIRLGAAVESSCIAAASMSFRTASEHHFILEDIYSSAMDFTRTETLCNSVRHDILERLS